MDRFVSSLSSPRSTCNHSPVLLNFADQEPVLPCFGTLLSRVSQGSWLGLRIHEDAVMDEFGNALLSIPSAWMLHTVKRKEKTGQ